MRGSGTILTLLDLETQAFHTEANRSWEHLLENSHDSRRDDYLCRLAVAYGFEAPFEISRRYTPGLAELIALPMHERAGLIVRALVALGWSGDDITNIQCTTFSLFSDTPEALAWMYVIERSALIQSDVRQRLAIKFRDIASATASLAVYDSSASARRSELGLALDRINVSEKVYRRVIDGACTGFGALIEWQRAMEPLLRGAGRPRGSADRNASA